LGRFALLLPLLLPAALLGGCGYSEIQELDEQAGTARADIEVQLLRRAELVPALVETVQRFGSFDEFVIEAVADSRVGLVAAVRSGDMSRIGAASAALSSALDQLLAGAAAYYDNLAADPGFQRLRSQLDGTEEQIVLAGSLYNDAVRRYNEYIAAFPQLVTAKIIGADMREPFEPQGNPVSPSSADE
jgi:LemA protein